jgi:hypothetical protein
MRTLKLGGFIIDRSLRSNTIAGAPPALRGSARAGDVSSIASRAFHAISAASAPLNTFYETGSSPAIISPN